MTGQDGAAQDETKRDTTREDWTRQDQTRPAQTAPDQTIQDKTTFETRGETTKQIKCSCLALFVLFVYWILSCHTLHVHIFSSKASMVTFGTFRSALPLQVPESALALGRFFERAPFRGSGKSPTGLYGLSVISAAGRAAVGGGAPPRLLRRTPLILELGGRSKKWS